MKILCLCRQGVNRSRAIAEYLQSKGHEAMYAGVEPDSFNSVSQEMIDWADLIITARGVHAELLDERFDISKKVISLDIKNGSYADPRVQKEVEEQLGRYLPLH